MANDSTTTYNKIAHVTFKRGDYNVQIACFVGNIKHDLMLGTPWFESIIIKDLDWHYKTIQFVDK